MVKNKILLAKVIIWLFAVFLIVRLIWLALHNDLGANPVEFIEHSTGIWALVFLLVSLSMTPIRLLTGSVWPVQLRRLLGLWFFALASLHLCAYVILDFAFLFDEMMDDIFKHPRIWLGALAYVLSIPLVITSNQAMMRRLKSRWKTLHRAVYLIALLVILHFLWLVKKDLTEPIYYAVLLAILFGIRLLPRFKRSLST